MARVRYVKRLVCPYRLVFLQIWADFEVLMNCQIGCRRQHCQCWPGRPKAQLEEPGGNCHYDKHFLTLIWRQYDLS